MSWIASDLIIKFGDLVIAGFVGAIGNEIYKKLKNKIKDILRRGYLLGKSGIRFTYFVFMVNDIRLYFEFDKSMLDTFDLAFEKMFSENSLIQTEFLRFYDFNPKPLFGEFSSVTFIYDTEEGRWLISHLNK
jgi:hypothetical protein